MLRLRFWREILYPPHSCHTHTHTHTNTPTPTPTTDTAIALYTSLVATIPSLCHLTITIKKVNMRRLLTALPLFLLHLVYPTLSFIACGQQTSSRRQFNPFGPVKLSSRDGEGESNATPNIADDNANLFERAVRKVTRNKKYKFGDLAKSAASASTKTFEGVVRTVTRDEEYHFGDYSKKVLSTSTGTFENAVKSITGNEGYQFGVS